MWKHIITLFFLATLAHCSLAQYSFAVKKDHIQLNWSIANNKVSYEVKYKNEIEIAPSELGVIINDSISTSNSLQLLKVDSSFFDETWNPVWGEVKTIRNNYKQLKLFLKSGSVRWNIIFRVFNDGVGFRYEFPFQKDLIFLTLKNELTEFNLPADHKAFWIPGDFDSNEYLYTTSKISQINSSSIPMLSQGLRSENIPDKLVVQTPLMLKSAKGVYINIHEAALVNYPAMFLKANTISYKMTTAFAPSASNVAAYLKTSFCSPWRTILISDKATDILSSKTILNLNEPNKLANASWIHPMKYIGVWWEMQTGKSSWSYTDNHEALYRDTVYLSNNRHGANTGNVKKYIDFASKNGIEGVLVEGWNRGWEASMGFINEKNFDFVTPYSDFDIDSITRYAKSRNVQIVMHHETGASVSNYERQLDTALAFMKRFGYKSVKTGYVGRIVPRGEHHDGQSMVNHYAHTIQKAADKEIAINIHEPMRPTGLHRTYPNFLASEAGRGNEWNAFSDGNPPEHETILPFTRLIGGPMDYTPGIFKIKNLNGDSSRRVHTTLAKQLALYVVLYSPLQMAADLPENYEEKPDAFEFIRRVPVDWDTTWVLGAEPGEYVITARKSKGKDEWFVGGITDEHSRTFKLPLSFLPRNKSYTIKLFKDADAADWERNPEAYEIETFNAEPSQVLSLKMAGGGGFAMIIELKNKPKI